MTLGTFHNPRKPTSVIVTIEEYWIATQSRKNVFSVYYKHKTKSKFRRRNSWSLSCYSSPNMLFLLTCLFLSNVITIHCLPWLETLTLSWIVPSQTKSKCYEFSYYITNPFPMPQSLVSWLLLSSSRWTALSTLIDYFPPVLLPSKLLHIQRDMSSTFLLPI